MNTTTAGTWTLTAKGAQRIVEATGESLEAVTEAAKAQGWNVETTPYPTNATFLAHTSHVSRDRQDDRCRLCADNGTRVPITWGSFVATYPEWAALRHA